VVKKNKVVTGKVSSVSSNGIALRLPGDFRGLVPPADSGPEQETIAVGDFVKCMVLSCKDKEQCVLSLDLTPRYFMVLFLCVLSVLSVVLTCCFDIVDY
jgi:hypothetical protein